MLYYKTGSFSSVSILGRVVECKPFVSKKDGKAYRSLVVSTQEKYKTKDGEEKSSVSEVRVFSEGTEQYAVGNVLLIAGEVATSTVKFKTELKYPVWQIVVINARCQKVADTTDSSFTGLNLFELIGRVGRQPREIKGGKGSEFCIAISPKDSETVWVPISFWGQRGTKLLSIVNKGDQVRVIGKASLGLKKVGEEEKKVLSLYGVDLQFLAKKKTEASESSSTESLDSIEQSSIEDADSEEVPF